MRTNSPGPAIRVASAATMALPFGFNVLVQRLHEEHRHPFQSRRHDAQHDLADHAPRGASAGLPVKLEEGGDIESRDRGDVALQDLVRRGDQAMREAAGRRKHRHPHRWPPGSPRIRRRAAFPPSARIPFPASPSSARRISISSTGVPLSAASTARTIEAAVSVSMMRSEPLIFRRAPKAASKSDGCASGRNV